MTTSREQRLDAALRCLATPRRHRVLSLVRASAPNRVSVEELAERLVAADDSTAENRAHVETMLHHVHLPKLESIETVRYDTQTGIVRYDRDSDVARALDVVDEVRAASRP